MKRMFRRRLMLILSIGMVCSLIIGYVLQIRMIRNDANTTSSWLFWQVQQILDENQLEADASREDWRNICMTRARAAAYLLENSSVDRTSVAELNRIAQLLSVDELHIFDETGTIVSGTHPEYYGYSFNSGEQMQFFLPLISDKSLQLCQDVTPNTAEGKPMQYAAVWQEDGSAIIQIGMNPERVLDALKKNQLSYVFSLLTDTEQAELCAVDPDTYEILGATDAALQGQSLPELGFNPQRLAELQGELVPCPIHPHEAHSAPVPMPRTLFHGARHYCVFAMVDDLLMFRAFEESKLFAPAFFNLLMLAGLMTGVFLLMQLCIAHYLDEVVLQGIATINGKLRNITDGRLDERIDVTTTPELAQLSLYINDMVRSILSTTDKLSLVLHTVQLPIAVYEYSPKMNRVFFTSKLPEILGLTPQQGRLFLRNRKLFEETLTAMKFHPVGDNVFRIAGGRYVRSENYNTDTNVFGLVMDVTAEVEEKQRLEWERNIDPMTGLLNRRGFHEQLELLFTHPERLQNAALMIMDTDDLKYVNDHYGHVAGDRYLLSMARTLGPNSTDQLVSRLSGDEFALFIYGCDTESHLRHRVAQLRAAQDPAPVGDAPPVRFSMGAALYPLDAADYHTLLKLADERMYENKRQRKANRT